MKRYVVIDTETGGLDPYRNPILSLYMGIYIPDYASTIAEELNINILPAAGYEINSKAMEINGIDLEQHKLTALNRVNSGKAVGQFLEFWGNNTTEKDRKLIPILWNANFDLSFILSQVVTKEIWDAYVSHRYIDVMGIVRFFYDIGSLQQTAKHFNIDTGTAHTAKDDAATTLAVYQRLVDLRNRIKENNLL